MEGLALAEFPVLSVRTEGDEGAVSVLEFLWMSIPEDGDGTVAGSFDRMSQGRVLFQ